MRKGIKIAISVYTVLALVTACTPNVPNNANLKPNSLNTSNSISNKYSVRGKALFPTPSLGLTPKGRGTNDSPFEGGKGVLQVLQSNSKSWKSFNPENTPRVLPSGRPVSEGEGYNTKATLTDIGKKAIVSLIYPPEHANANKTIATGLTNDSGNFEINPTVTFNPTNDDIFVLEAQKRFGAAGDAVITIRTYIQWDSAASNWDSMTYSLNTGEEHIILINTKTTALAIIDSYQNDPDNISAAQCIHSINVTTGTSVPDNPIGSTNGGTPSSIPDTTVISVANLVNTLLNENVDAVRNISFQGNKYYVNHEPNHAIAALNDPNNNHNCPYCELKYESLTNKDFSNGDFSYANLYGADLTDTIFTGATLTGANLTNANFSNVDFSNRDFTNYDFTNANLSNVNFTDTILTGTNFTGSTLTSTNFTNVDFNNRNFTGYNFTSANFTSANLSNSTLNSVNFTTANLNNANLSDVTLSGATLAGATLTGTNFTNVNLSSSNFNGYNFTDAIFTGGNLSNANLTSVNFTNANLSNANLTNATITGVTLTGANLSDTHYADYSYCDTGSTGTCNDMHINTYTTNEQRKPAVAMNSNGQFIVAWFAVGTEDSAGVFAQRYNSDGTPNGSNFLVNTFLTSSQKEPSVAMDNNGNFVISWESKTQEGEANYYGVFAQRYNSSGAPQIPTGCGDTIPVCDTNTGEFLVNTSTTGNQKNSAVGMDSTGNFVITWEGVATGDTSGGIFAQKYYSDGSPNGSNFLVNTYTGSTQTSPSVSMNSSGVFVIAWAGPGNGDSSSLGGVFAQKYSSDGSTNGTNFKVNSYTTGTQANVSVSIDGGGNFVVAWSGPGVGDGDVIVTPATVGGIFAQRFLNSGTENGSNFKVNTYITSTQALPSVAMDSSGNFVISWSGPGSGDSYGIFTQRYNSSGSSVGSNVKVNNYTANNQKNVSIAMDSSSDVIISWHSKVQEGEANYYGIYSRRYKFN